jgi:hypothetical protein
MEGYAMTESIIGAAEVIRLRLDISSLLRQRVLEAVQRVLEEELSEALGTGRYERSQGRLGYRNGHETPTLPLIPPSLRSLRVNKSDSLGSVVVPMACWRRHSERFSREGSIFQPSP